MYGFVFMRANLVVVANGKVKAIQLQALTGSEDSRRLRLPDFKI
jgi:hypothetical protein